MKFKVIILAKSKEIENSWTSDLASKHFNRVDIQILSSSAPVEEADVILLDQNKADLENVLNSLNRKKQWAILISENPNLIPPQLANALVDDVLIYPFRTVEVVSKFKALEKLQEWKLLKELNLSFGGILKSLEDSYRLAERAQKAALPKKFPQVKGFKVVTRYFAGSASGGDYYDLFEMEGESKLKNLCLILSHSSTYRLSSAVMNAFSDATASYSKNNTQTEVDPAELVEKILSQLRPSMKEKDQLSLTLAVISRSQGKMTVVNFGENRIYYSDRNTEPFSKLAFKEKLPKWNATQIQGVPLQTLTLSLANKGRLAFISHGFITCMGGKDLPELGEQAVKSVLNQFRAADAVDTLNELAFQTKSNIPLETGLPAQDCTAVIIDIDSLNVRSLEKV